MSNPLRMVSICRSLPTPTNPSSGVFVLNRLAAMAKYSEVFGLQPVPYCPVLAPLPEWARQPRRVLQGVAVAHAPMFYVPAVLKHLDGSWLRRSILPHIRTLHEQHGLDLIDAHFGYPEGVGSVAVGQSLRIPTFITVRGFEDEFATRPLVGPAMLHALRQATGCVAVSYFLKEFLLRHGVKEERIAVIHNAIDGSIFSYGDVAAARNKLGLPADRKLVVSVGHLVSRKRHHVLIQAIAEIHRQYPNLTLAIVGASSFERTYPEQLASLVARHGLTEVVKFVGNIASAEVVHWLRAADVFALGTAREGCCNAVLEALAAGVPVVTTPAGDNAYFVKDGQNGAIVPIDDVAAMASAITTTLARSWNRREISRALTVQVGSWDGVAGRVLDFFETRLAAQ